MRKRQILAVMAVLFLILVSTFIPAVSAQGTQSQGAMMAVEDGAWLVVVLIGDGMPRPYGFFNNSGQDLKLSRTAVLQQQVLATPCDVHGNTFWGVQAIYVLPAGTTKIEQDPTTIAILSPFDDHFGWGYSDLDGATQSGVPILDAGKIDSWLWTEPKLCTQ